jgi:nucleotide-binding universal stress UspA family protein
MKILIAVDSVDFNKVIAEFVNAHNWNSDTTVRVIHVIESQLLDSSQVSFLPFFDSLIENERVESENLVADMSHRIEIGKQTTAQVFTEVLEGHPYDRIVQAAREWQADLLIVGSHGRKGISRFTLGSVSSAVVALAPCSVVVLRLPSATKKSSESDANGDLVISLA